MSDLARSKLSPVAASMLPGHIGIIMDGNGRWAMQQGLPRHLGHKRGARAVREVVRAGREMGLRALTLFAFSSQNWDRPAEEVFHLMELLREYLHEEREEILDNQIRLTTVGETERLPGRVREPLEELMAESAHHQGMTLCLALSYGGREMIARAAQDICRAALAGKIDPSEISPQRFAEYLPSSQRLPPLDLLIRTSGERRVSNFFLWEVAYAELHFSSRMWPEFCREDLLEAVRDYATRERRFGRVASPASTDSMTPARAASGSGPQ